MFNRKCKITFIAHGSTIYSEENRVSDKLDYPPLNDNGYAEISKIVDFIKKRGLKTDNIYCSPALCCVQSAEILADELKQDFTVLNDLYNRKCGDLSGLTVEKIIKKYPEAKKNVPFSALKIAPNNGEDLSEFNERVENVISDIIENNIRGRIIVITHPSVIQAAICNALNVPAEQQYKIYVKQASATQISYFKDWASLVYSDYTPI